VTAADRQVLDASTDPKALVHSAQVLATSADPGDHGFLLDKLRDASFLERLDDDAAYDGHKKRLRVWRVLRTLGRHVDASRARVLTALAQDATFLDEPPRVDLLIEACAVLRPPPPEVLAFWDAHCQPDDGYANLTVGALVANATPAALDLLLDKLRDAAFDDEDKLEWLRQDVLPNRDHPEVVRAAARGLRAGLPAPVDHALVEVMFDWRPTEWYRPATLQKPPDPGARSDETREARRELAEVARDAVDLDEATDAAVTRGLEEDGS